MKNSKLSFWAIAISILAVMGNCSKKSTDPSPTTTQNNNQSSTSLELSTSSASFSSSSDSYTVTITTSGSWSINDDISWISVSPSSGTGNAVITIYASSNSSSSSRTGSISITSGSVTKFIALNQSGSSSSGGGGGGGTSYGTVTFYKRTSNGPTDVSFRGNYFTLTSSSIYSSDPGCNASGCKTFVSVPYGTYTWSASVYNAAGNTLLYSGSGSVTVNSTCKTVAITTY